MADLIPAHKMSAVGNEEKYLLEVLASGKWVGRGAKTQALEKLSAQSCGVKHSFFVTSGTAALELGCLLADLKPGDEVITPSFAFTSSANAIVLRGAKPVFADIDSQLWNITRETVEPLVTKKTKAVLPIYYGGSTAGREELSDLCREKNLFLIEDAAQALGTRENDKALGVFKDISCISLHETKNLSCGEGGLIFTDSDDLANNIEIRIEKGTNRQQFFRGQVDKYRWVEVGSSYIASDLLAAVALAQFEKISEITEKRRRICSVIAEGLRKFEGKISWQKVPARIQTNGHLAAFTVDPKIRDRVLTDLKAGGLQAIFHYVPLHDAPLAKDLGFMPEKDLPHTRRVSEGLVRLPVFYSMTDKELEQIVERTTKVLEKI